MSSKNEHEKQNKLLNNDNYVNAKNKKNSTKKATNKKKMRMKTFYQNIWDKLFKEYNNDKNFNSFINESCNK